MAQARAQAAVLAALLALAAPAAAPLFLQAGSLHARDSDGDRVPDAQERVDGTDPGDPQDNLLELLVDGEFAVGKRLRIALVHPSMGPLPGTRFTLEVGGRRLELVSDATGYVSYELVNSGLHRLTAYTERFSLSKTFSPFCAFPPPSPRQESGSLSLLLLYLAFMVGVLSYNVNLRQIRLHSQGFRRIVGLVSLYVGLAFFALPLLVSAYLNLTLAFLLALFELAALLYLNYLYKLHVYTGVPTLARTKKARFYRRLFAALALAEDSFSRFLSPAQRLWLRRALSRLVVRAVTAFNHGKARALASLGAARAPRAAAVPPEVLRQRALAHASRLGELEALEAELVDILRQQRQAARRGVPVPEHELEAARRDLAEVRAERRRIERALARDYSEMA